MTYAKTILASVLLAGLSGAMISAPATAKDVRFKGSLEPAFKSDQRRYLGRVGRKPRVAGFRRHRNGHRTTPSHYHYRDFPYWAARAFQPRDSR